MKSHSIAWLLAALLAGAPRPAQGEDTPEPPGHKDEHSTPVPEADDDTQPAQPEDDTQPPQPEDDTQPVQPEDDTQPPQPEDDTQPPQERDPQAGEEPRGPENHEPEVDAEPPGAEDHKPEAHLDPDLGVVVEYADDAMPKDNGRQEQMPSKSAAPIKRDVNFAGTLKEKGTRKPIADVTVYLKDTPHTAVTDKNGVFVFSNLTAGTYTVVIPSTEYEMVETTETITRGERIEVVYYLEPRVYGGLQVTVRGKRVEKEVSRSVISMQEARVIPGTSGDPLRAIESMPSVARGGLGGGGYQDLVIRGSNAEDSKIYLDGHQLPGVFHFGGFKSVYNSELIDKFELYAGGFGAQWGRATGGVVEIETRDPRDDRWGGYADLSMIDVSALAEGPVADDLSVALAARRSSVDLILAAIDLNDMVDGLNFTTYPVYYDYQGKLHYRLDRRNRLSLDVYGGYDGMEMDLDLVDDRDPALTGESDVDIDFESAFVHYLYDDGTLSSDLSPGYFRFAQTAIFGEFHLSYAIQHIDINEDARIKIGKHNTLGAGLRLQPRFITVDSNFIRPPKEGDVHPSFTNDERVVANVDEHDLIVSAYLQDEIELGPVKLVPGIHWDYESVLSAYAVEPRGAVRLKVVEPLTLKAGGGIYHRVPEPDEIFEPWGNSDLDMERAMHAIGGFEWSITEVLELDVQGYYKHLDQLVAPTGDERVYDNSGDGYVYGGEVMLRHNWTDRFFGWVSYSISRSMRNDGAGTPHRPFDMDQRHNLVALASWQFAKGWRLGGRFQFTSGEPYTRIRGSIFNADTGSYLPYYDETKKNAQTRPPYHRFDLRLDKQWVFDAWVLHTYLDVRNVYVHPNPVATVHNYDFSEEAYFTDIPILPSIGVMAEF